ncbi:MAG: long-chain fatty acid--CoA ligase [Burkholderiales bacterium]|jgi:fatty-acyl-CoA synthase|nr:long-chain fatty acid--CoA ligase [Burkholderiales bacterium]
MLSTMGRVPLTLTHFLDRAGQLFGNVEIVSRMPDKSLHRTNYAAFHRRARQLAQALQHAGLKAGDRVATLMWNHYAHFEAYFGVIASGGVLHTLNLRLAPDEIAWIANHARDRFLIVDDVLLPLLAKFRDQVAFERVIVVSLTGAPVAAPDTDYEAFLASAPHNPTWTYPDMHEDDAVAMCYTSGTTGRPKGVTYSHRSQVLHSLAQCLPDAIGISGRDVILPVVPMFHANAWGVPYSAAMLGIKMVFPGPHLHPDDLLPLFESEQVTISCGVPTIWLGMVQILDARAGRYRFSPQLRLTVGGSAVPEALIRGFAKHGIEVIQGWGMTETSPLATIAKVKQTQGDVDDDVRFATHASQGYPIPLVDLRIVADDGVQPWDGQAVGEIQVRGPWITAAYHEVPVAEESFTADGWLRTGDVAAVTPDGFVRITDRTKDLIKSGGEWISSVDLENAIMGHPAVAEAAVVAVPHPKWAERPLAVVVAKAGQTVTADALRAHLAPLFAKWAIPDAFAFVDAIPRTSTGKFLKTKLRDQYRDWDWDAAARGDATPPIAA